MAKKMKKAAKAAPKKSAAKPAKKAAAKSIKKSAKAAAKKSAPKPKALTRKAAKPAATQGESGLQTVAPGFTCGDVEKSIAWYSNVLGFNVKQRWENEGKLMGAEMNSGSVTFNLGQDDWKMGRDRVKGVGLRMYITTGPRIDQLADAIKSRGGTLTQEPTDTWGMRTFAIDDPDGFKLTFMTTPKK